MFNRIRSILARPYPQMNGVAQDLRLVLVFACFTWLFLWYFLPFNLNLLPQGEYWWRTAYYGLVVAVCLLVNGQVLTRLFPRVFAETHWTVGRQLLWTMLNMLTVAAGILAHSVWMGYTVLSWQSILRFLFITVAVGGIPLTALLLLREIQLLRQNLDVAQQMNLELAQAKHATGTTQESTAPHCTLVAENDKDELTFAAAALLFIAAADNYVEVYVASTSGVQKHLLRCSMKRAESQLATHPTMMRVHRAYFVNLSHVIHVSGNAQGQRLHLAHTDQSIPVARAQREGLLARLHSRTLA